MKEENSKDKLEFDEEKHLYKLNGIEMLSVNEVLELAGLQHYYGDLTAMNFGKAVHKTTELYDRNDLDIKSLDLALVPYLERWIKFLADNKIQIMPQSIEQMVYSKDYWYAGRYDRIVGYQDKWKMLDIKTGQWAPTAGLQLAGYVHAHNELYPHVKVEGRMAVNLTTGKFKIYDDEKDFGVFLGCCQVVHFGLKHKLIKREKE